MKICTHAFLRTIQAGLVIALAGCATQTHDVFRQSVSFDTLERDISSALLAGKPAEARETLAAALRTQPQNGYFHLLNGLSYQIEDGSLQSLALAKVGYDAAVKFVPGHFWSHFLAGSVALDLQDYAEAAEHFSRAILNDPDRPQAFLGLAIAAYFTGDLEVAHAAAHRALALVPMDPMALRTAAYVAAASGERGRLEAVLTKAEAVPIAAHDLAIHKTRLTQLLRTATLAQRQGDSDDKQSEGQPEKVASPNQNESANQVMVEVTILLNQASTVHNTGINLLDGLTVQFGLEHLTERRALTGTPTAFSRVFHGNKGTPDHL